MSQLTRGETLICKRQNNKVFFTCQLDWVGFDQLHLYLYIYVSLEFLLPILNKFTKDTEDETKHSEDDT